MARIFTIIAFFAALILTTATSRAVGGEPASDSAIHEASGERLAPATPVAPPTNAEAPSTITPSPLSTPRPLSSGCRVFNENTRLDSQYYSIMLQMHFYNAGEHIVIRAVPLVRGDPSPVITLSVNSPPVDTAVFPGSGEYIFAADGSYQIGWRGDRGDAIWIVSCATT
jgi:hypothetical protein